MSSLSASELFELPEVQSLIDEMCAPESFVSQLHSGALPRKQFQAYILQDKYFLFEFSRAYAAALILAETPERQAVFHGLIGGVMEELKLHRGLCDEWGVDPTDSTLTPSPACQAYCDFLGVQRQRAKSIAEIAAAMVPCMRLYAHLGQSYVSKGEPDAVYAKWFEEYSSGGFEELARSLEVVLDEEISAGGNASATVQSNYVRAMELERDFFAQHASRL